MVTIDITKIPIAVSEYDEFIALCQKIHFIISSSEVVNLFDLSSELAYKDSKFFDLALFTLIENGSISNSSKGFDAGPIPCFVGHRRDLDGAEDSDVDSSDIQAKRLNDLLTIESKLEDCLSSPTFYNPESVLEYHIDSIGKSTTRTILHRYLVDGHDFEELSREYKGAGKVINRFLEDYDVDSSDLDVYQEFDLSDNTFKYLMNRSISHCRLIKNLIEPGYCDILKSIFDTTTEGYLIEESPGSDIMCNLRDRTLLAMNLYFNGSEMDFFGFIEVMLSITENRSHVLFDLISIYQEFFDEDFIFNENDANRLLDRYIISDGRIKHLTSVMIMSLRDILAGEEKINYGISVAKLFDSHKDLFIDHYIESKSELYDFIVKYTDYQIRDDRILKGCTLVDAISNFIMVEKIYDKDRLKSKYNRVCGGPGKVTYPVIDSIDMNSFTDDRMLTDEEFNLISDRLKDYEWITSDNVWSLFSDIYGLEQKFTEMNMHFLGFTPFKEIYFRSKYPTFIDCISQNEFVGDEVYTDDTEFRIKMECKAFQVEVENLQRKMHWMPVSEHRYINLKSGRYSRFASIVREYKDFVINLCRRQFVTPFSLMNIESGIADIDDDDFELSFYSSVLLASGVNHKTFSGQRFYYRNSDSSPYECRAPEFVRYLVYEAGGILSIDELKTILEDKYGIKSNAPIIRNIVKLSSCRYSNDTDTIYLDDEMYMEALSYE